jgi:phenylalanyl-tRNA synthetase beta subunit
MNQGMTTIFVSTEQMLAEENGFSEENLSVLLDAMASTLPTLKKGIPSEVQIELRKKLEADKVRFKRDEDAKRIDRMMGELGGA